MDLYPRDGLSGSFVKSVGVLGYPWLFVTHGETSYNTTQSICGIQFASENIARTSTSATPALSVVKRDLEIRLRNVSVSCAPWVPVLIGSVYWMNER